VKGNLKATSKNVIPAKAGIQKGLKLLDSRLLGSDELIIIRGSLKTEKWEDRDGNKKQITKVIGSKLIMLGERKKPVVSLVELPALSRVEGK
jgi:hypothetical protein